MNSNELTRGFLPATDPAIAFPAGSPFSIADQVGHDLPSLLLEPDARQYLRQLEFPLWSELPDHDLRQQQLYYVRLGFIASGYINQTNNQTCFQLPKNIAQPLCDICQKIQRPPILSYDGYALYNWKRFDNNKPVALGNIDTIQNFVHLYDEHWFILIHVDIEAKATDIVNAIQMITLRPLDTETLNSALNMIANSLEQQIDVLKRIPEKMSDKLYFKYFRPYIRFFEKVTYEGVSHSATDFRGETGAQSSIMPSLIALLKIPHQTSSLTNHLKDMRRYMPAKHRQFINQLENLPAIKNAAASEHFNRTLEAIAHFREIHYQWAKTYINDHVSDPRGTGGTPYMHWLKQLIDETRAFKH